MVFKSKVRLLDVLIIIRRLLLLGPLRESMAREYVSNLSSPLSLLCADVLFYHLCCDISVFGSWVVETPNLCTRVNRVFTCLGSDTEVWGIASVS